MKKWLSFIAVLAVVVFGWYFKMPIEKLSSEIPDYIKSFYQSPVLQKVEDRAANLTKQVFAPPPLKKFLSPTPAPSSASKSKSADPKVATQLTSNGVIYWTNINRNQNGGLRALTENSRLDEAAQLKMSDMFKQQYFEHESPQGKGPADLANQVGYEYISIGENLALGDFSSDQALVADWMNSPGHRANILNTKFEEIGVAVGQGQYQGRKVWIAVQEFGKPASSCPSVDANLKAQIDLLQNDINVLKPQLDQKQAELDALNPKTPAEYQVYNQTLADYNNLVKIYNNKVDALKLDDDQYNAQVRAYNACLAQ